MVSPAPQLPRPLVQRDLGLPSLRLVSLRLPHPRGDRNTSQPSLREGVGWGEGKVFERQHRRTTCLPHLEPGSPTKHAPPPDSEGKKRKSQVLHTLLILGNLFGTADCI